MSSRGATFGSHYAIDLDAAVAVARFAHTYDAPHALRDIQAYLTAFVDERFRTKQAAMMSRHVEDSSVSMHLPIHDVCKGAKSYDRMVLEWAVMADKFDMHELRGHCERAMMMYWEQFYDRSDLVDRLSHSALQRIAKGLSKSLMHSAAPQNRSYPDAVDFINWGQMCSNNKRKLYQ